MKPITRMPGSVWALGFVSLLMDLSSEMIHSLLPLYLAGPLGLGALAIGLLEGGAESMALGVKVFSGMATDRLRRRKGLALAGYALAAAAKPLFALAPGAGLVVAGRLLDRVGKGIRGAPRDALVADLAPPGSRGAAFGLCQALDTVGAFLGPLAAAGLMLLWVDDFRAVFRVAVIPALLSVAVLLVCVREPHGAPAGPVARPAQRLDRAAVWQLGPACWRVVGLGVLTSLARLSEAFLVLRARQLGLPLAAVPLVMVAMNLVYAAAAYPFGILSDHVSRRVLLAGGMALLALAELTLALATGWPGLLGGLALWGMHMAMTQGLLAALVADTAPAALRGTAFGVFNLASGAALLASGALAGLLWDLRGAALALEAGALVAGLCVVLLVLRPRWVPDRVEAPG